MARKKISQNDVVTFDDATPGGLAPGLLRLSANDKVEFDPAPGDIAASEATAAGKAAGSILTPPDPLNPIERAWEATKGAGRALMGVPAELAADPGAAPRSLATGAARASTLGATKDLHGPALDRMRIKALAGKLEPGDLQTLSMWQDAVEPGRERAPITDPLAAIDALQGVHRETEKATAAQPGLQLMGGLLAPTPGKTVGGAVMRGAKAAGAGGRVLASGAAGLASGATDAGGQSAAAGNDFGQILRDMAQGGGTGLAMGLAGGASVEGGRKVLQSVFPAVKDFASAREAGSPVLDDGKWQYRPGEMVGGPNFRNPRPPEMGVQARASPVLPHGRAGVKAVAFGAADAIEAKKEQLLRAVGELHAEAMRKAGAKPADLQPFLDRLAELDAKARFPEGDVMPGKEGVSNMAGETFDRVAAKPRTVEGMVEFRRASAEAGAPESQSPTDSQLARRDVYGAIRSSVRESAPEVAAADDAYAAAKQSAARTNENLYGTPKDPRIAADAENAPAPISPRDRIKAMTRLARYGERETAEPSTSIQPYLDDLAAQDPEFAKALDAILAKKALEDTRGGLGHGTQKDLQGVMHTVHNFASTQARALARRADDVVLRGAGQRSSAASNFQRFLDAYEEDRRRNQSRADAMRPAR